MNENTEKVLSAEDLFDQFLDLKRQKARIESQKTQIQLEKEEIEKTKNSIEYLRLIYEKSKLNELVNDSKQENQDSLKVHLYAVKFQVNQLKEQLDKLNSIISLSPYVYMLIDIESMTIDWVSQNIKLFGYDYHRMKGANIGELLLDSKDDLSVKDGFILNHPLKRQDGSLTWVDLHFNLNISSDQHLTVVTFHEVKERYME